MSDESNPASEALVQDPETRQEIEKLLCIYIEHQLMHLRFFSGFAKDIAERDPATDSMHLLDSSEQFFVVIRTLLGVSIQDIADWIQTSDASRWIRLKIPKGYRIAVVKVNIDDGPHELWVDDLYMIVDEEAMQANSTELPE
ncbi:MAG: hypothetical protein ABIP74_02435 [Candidatus Saccharimonas sp.]